MPYLTLTKKNLKLQLSLGLVVSSNIQPGNRVALFWDTKHTHMDAYLLTCRTHMCHIMCNDDVKTDDTVKSQKFIPVRAD